jgi:hypothetical protein
VICPVSVIVTLLVSALLLTCTYAFAYVSEGEAPVWHAFAAMLVAMQESGLGRLKSMVMLVMVGEVAVQQRCTAPPVVAQNLLIA